MKVHEARWITIVIGVLFAGCAVGPDYTRPTITTPEKFRGQVTPVEAASLADYQAFYRIYLNAFRAFGTPPYGPNYFPALWERLAAERGIDVHTAGLEALDRLWEEAKTIED